MFSHSQNLLITGGVFTQSHVENHFDGTKATGIDVLLQASAPGAFHNAGERFDPPKCHPNTRNYILTKIINWVIGQVGWDGLMMWLYGPAGAGKSAIAQTIAEACHARHLLLASFFFSKTDPKRNNEKCLIPSIAYQIASNIPEARNAIEAAVDRDPAIFQRSVEAQFTSLIIDPLTQLSLSGIFNSTPIPYLIIIDGLDECREPLVQQHILHTISSALQQPAVSLKFLICSRAEHHLNLEFTSLISGQIAACLSLEDGYDQDADIERYLTDSFDEICKTHPLKQYIPGPIWPSHQVISTLVEKSSRQFIYAATVVKYVSSNRHQPTRRLEIILGLQPPRKDLPFAELDSLYLGILSSIQDIEATIPLLAVLILTDIDPKTPKMVGAFMSLDPGEVHCMLLDFASLVKCVDENTEIQMLHASFPDFLLDQSRSKTYYIDSSILHAEIAQLCLSYIREHASKRCSMCFNLEGMCCPIMDYIYCNIVNHLSEAHPSAVEGLREALLHTPYITSLIAFERTGLSMKIDYLLAHFLSFLQGSKFANTEELYLHHHHIWETIIHTRIASFPWQDLGFIICLVLIEMELYIDDDDEEEEEEESAFNFTDYFSTSEGGVTVLERRYSALYFDPMQRSSMDHGYCMLLGESLSNPVHAGKYVLDGPQCALAARFLLDCFMRPCPEHKFLGYINSSIALRLFDEIENLLSKASSSDELVARINHTNLIFDLSTSPRFSRSEMEAWCTELDEILPTLVNGIGTYLMRVIGSVPIGLRGTHVIPELDFEKSYNYIP